MNFKTYDHSQNYTAQVIKLPVKQSVPGLDNLVRVNVFGNDCLIGKDSPENELYLFFPAGCQLSADFCKYNNLFRESQLNFDSTQKGFFEENGRVKAVKFRGITSTGFVIPLASLNNMNLPTWDSIKEGDSFNEFMGVEICRKYFVPTSTQATGTKKDRISRINDKLSSVLIPGQFRLHSETPHLGNNLHRLNPEDIIVITDKWHGSSCILSKVYVSKKLSLWQKLINAIGGKIPNRQLSYIYSSGKPKSNLPKGIEGLWKNDGPDFYNADIWKTAMKDFKPAIEDGISLYGELVGFTADGSAIQKGYDYGCVMCANVAVGENHVGVVRPNHYRFLVYKITYTKPDGNVIKFSWQQLKDYCTKYNLEHVKEFFFGSLREWTTHYSWSETSENVMADFLYNLQNMYNLEDQCKHCNNKVPAEGIVISIDGKEEGSSFKLKAKAFTKKESDDADKGETNIEDGQ
jgi:hypothetical protein